MSVSHQELSLKSMQMAAITIMPLFVDWAQCAWSPQHRKHIIIEMETMLLQHAGITNQHVNQQYRVYSEREIDIDNGYRSGHLIMIWVDDKKLLFNK